MIECPECGRVGSVRPCVCGLNDRQPTLEEMLAEAKEKIRNLEEEVGKLRERLSETEDSTPASAGDSGGGVQPQDDRSLQDLRDEEDL